MIQSDINSEQQVILKVSETVQTLKGSSSDIFSLSSNRSLCKQSFGISNLAYGVQILKIVWSDLNM